MTRFAPALPSLLRRAALLLALATASVPALAAPPTDGDINRLLSASRAQSMIDTMVPQIEAMQQQQFQQVAAQRQLTAQQQEQLKRIQARTSQTLRQAMSWQQLRPMYVDLYKKTFSKEDVLAMAEFYERGRPEPAGQDPGTDAERDGGHPGAHAAAVCGPAERPGSDRQRAGKETRMR